jgi:hypothetical protein
LSIKRGDTIRNKKGKYIKSTKEVYSFLMKRITLVIAFVLLLSGCGQSNEERARELIKQSCAIIYENTDGWINTDAEPLIRQAVDLDERFRPYLIGWMDWAYKRNSSRTETDPVIKEKLS